MRSLSLLLELLLPCLLLMLRQIRCDLVLIQTIDVRDRALPRRLRCSSLLDQLRIAFQGGLDVLDAETFTQTLATSPMSPCRLLKHTISISQDHPVADVFAPALDGDTVLRPDLGQLLPGGRPGVVECVADPCFQLDLGELLLRRSDTGLNGQTAIALSLGVTIELALATVLARLC